MRVLVICGGSSAERAVSLRSGESIERALVNASHEVLLYDPHIDSFGKELERISLKVDVVFPIVHGKGGEDGVIQRKLETLGLPYVGSSSEVSANCFDKLLTLKLIGAAGIKTPHTELITLEQLNNHFLANKPFVLKPNTEGSSVDTYLIRKPEEFDRALVQEAFMRHGNMLIEELVDGTELTVAVLADESLPVIEIRPPKNQDFDYENKYNGSTQELCPPHNIDQKVQDLAQITALKVHEIMGCRDLSRSDFIVDKQGDLFFLEINTLPGMTDQSLFPKAALAAGLTMTQLVDALVHLAQNRYR